jgi:hypothetical protein
MYIGFAEFTPDKPRYFQPGIPGATFIAQNVIPVSVNAQTGNVSYGPLLSFGPYATALPTRIQGAASHFSITEAVYTFAATATKIWLLQAGPSVFTDVSGTTYGAGDGDYWQFAFFGDQVITTNGNDPIQQYIIGFDTHFRDLANGGVLGATITAGGTAFTSTPTVAITGGGGVGATATATRVGTAITAITITNPGSGYLSLPTITITGGGGTGATATAIIADIAPTGLYIAVVRDFLFIGNIVDPIDGPRPQRIRWSGIGTSTQYPRAGTTLAAQEQSDFDEISGEFGEIVALIPAIGGNDLTVFLEHAIFIYQFAGPPAIFDRQQIQGGKGSCSPQSIVKVGPQIYYYGEDGFYRFDGSQSYPIGIDRVDTFFKNNLNQQFIARVQAVSSPNDRTVKFIYPSILSSSGVPDSMIIYNWALDKWSYASPTNYEYIFSSIAYGQTLDQGDLYWPTLDADPNTLDSMAFSSYRFVLAGFNTSHTFGYFDGAPLPAIVETPMFNIGNGTQLSEATRALIQFTRPVHTGPAPDATINIGTAETFDSGFSYTGPIGKNLIGQCPNRVSGRYLVAQLAVSSAFWVQLNGVEVTWVPQGMGR